MRIESLCAVHLPKSAVATQFDASGLIPGAFLLVSCQRWIWVCTKDDLPVGLDLEIHSGANAYEFLLRIACGLESQILGETDIFGQLKEAWFKAEISQKLRNELAPWIQKIFEDTKEIRSQHLQNLGGASYGTLIRKIIRDHHNGCPVLLVGAGQIARSIAPYLRDQEIWLWNRGAENLELLKRELGPEARIRVLSSAEEKNQAWKSAGHAVICVPVDAHRESTRAQAWSVNEKHGTVVHLGGYADQCGEWKTTQRFFALDAIFELQKTLGDVRSVQVSRARRACHERARLRSLGGSITIPHGWEDLAAFA